MSGPFNVEEICETSELWCNSLNLTGFIQDLMQKLVELAHLTKSGSRDYEGGHLEQRILKDFAWSHKSRAAVDYTLIGVEPHRPTRSVWPIATVTNDSQLHLVASSI